MPREEAENGPQAHAITKWLGRDSPGLRARAPARPPSTGPGWLLVCSDGLWNYASEAAALQTLIAELQRRPSAPTRCRWPRRWSRWANDQGGKDNITVALARHDSAAARLTRTTRRPAHGC